MRLIIYNVFEDTFQTYAPESLNISILSDLVMLRSTIHIIYYEYNYFKKKILITKFFLRIFMIQLNLKMQFLKFLFLKIKNHIFFFNSCKNKNK
jgi:hypothetical protein